MMNRIHLFVFISFCMLLVCGGYAQGDEMSENMRIGLAKMSANRFDEAQDYFEKEQQSNPGNSLAYYYSGEIYYRKADFSKALEYYQKAIEIEPSNLAYHFSAAMVYYAIGQFDKAIEEFQVVITGNPGTYQAKQAEQYVARIKSAQKDSGILKKWEAGEKAGQTQIIGKTQETDKSQSPQVGQQIQIESVVKDLKFGTLTKRKDASKLLYSFFSSNQLQPFLPDFIDRVNKEKDIAIKKNILFIIGKINTQQSYNYLFEVLDSPDQLFDIKIVAFQALYNYLTPDSAEKLKDVLSNLVPRRMKMREEIIKNIEAMEDKIDDIKFQKIPLEVEREKIRATTYTTPEQIDAQLADSFRSGSASIWTLQQYKDMKAEARNVKREIDAMVEEKDKQIERLNSQIAMLEEEKKQYENLLKKQFKGTGQVIGGVNTPRISEMSISSGSEDEQEQALALSLIKILGRLGKPEYIDVIERAWEEYRSNLFEPEYGLVRAQLGYYDYITKLAERLQDDYPSSNPNEAGFRAEIATVLGAYLSQNENQDYINLLAYLAESDPNEVVKLAASGALSKIKNR